MRRPIRLALIVEGHGEVEALPVLVGRLAREVVGRAACEVQVPHRISRGRLVQAESRDLGRALELAARRQAHAALIVLDADDDLACQLGPRLQQACGRLRGDLPAGVVLAVREFEAWFIAASHSLVKAGLLRQTLSLGPETRRDCKGLVRAAAVRGYQPAVDQATFAKAMSLEEARRAPSFGKLVREVTRLITSAALEGGDAGA